MENNMKAIVIKKDQHGEPINSMKLEEVSIPEIGPNEVLVKVMAAAVNFNGVWAAKGKPVSVFKMHGDDFHIAGSDASGVVYKIGNSVKRWKIGDEVIIHCNQSCGECPECNGFDPMACENQKIWGHETNYGSFAEYTKVQSQQLLTKPKHLSWEESASYGLTYFTAYRMLIDRAETKPGDNVLIWGAAGGLGIFAVQLCKLIGANPIAIISSEDKKDLVKSLGASMILNRKDFDLQNNPREFGKAIRNLTGGKDPDVVFEHVGKETFSTSVLLAKRFGKIVICGATSGYDLNFDVRHLWMRQKTIIGSHFANAYEATKANQLVIEKKIKPIVDQIFKFEETPAAHQLMLENKHKGKIVISIGVSKI